MLWAEFLNLCGAGIKYNLLRSHDGLVKKLAKKSFVLNLELEEFRSKYNRNNPAGSSCKNTISTGGQ